MSIAFTIVCNHWFRGFLSFTKIKKKFYFMCLYKHKEIIANAKFQGFVGLSCLSLSHTLDYIAEFVKVKLHYCIIGLIGNLQIQKRGSFYCYAIFFFTTHLIHFVRWRWKKKFFFYLFAWCKEIDHNSYWKRKRRR